MKEMKQKDSMSFEEVIKSYGSLVWKGNGKSMKPLIRENKDLVNIVAPAKLKPMDVVMYKTDGQYILHRLMKEDEDCYYMLGDNNIKMEHVPKDSVIGVMNGLVRDGKRIDLNGIRYRLYLTLWVKPWRLRVLITYIKRKAASLFGM